MGFLDKLFRRDDAATIDARRVYASLMAQSRKPNFYGGCRFPDNYDGRIDVLTLHIAAVLSNLNRFGENGERLGQALFDEMKDDFEIALREEALSDASVKKRIQPMISLFYDRVKRYAEALHDEHRTEKLQSIFSETLREMTAVKGAVKSDATFEVNIATYLETFDQSLNDLSLGQIALTEFEFPALPS